MKKKMSLIFSAAVFFTQLLTMTIVGLIFTLLIHTDIIRVGTSNKSKIFTFALIFIGACMVVGYAIAYIVTSIPIKSVDRMVNALNRLAEGDYTVRLQAKKNDHWALLYNSFNKLAAELQNTEVLQSDFTNNFSHEFKTPIVSVLGFTKLLKNGKLTEDEKKEYLAIIEEEMQRLSSMATNILNLTKIENQNILTGVTEFNVSEQIRTVILLLQNKWECKNIEPNLDFSEMKISANEEMLKQVWINLLDNAIKFTPEGGDLSIHIKKENNGTLIKIINEGPKIEEEDREKIFRKFYQIDKSHATEGTGIGLAIVKKIVQLHKGIIKVESRDNRNIFSVFIP